MPNVVARVIVERTGLSSAEFVGPEGTTWGPRRTSLEDALTWATTASRRVTVRDDSWDRPPDPDDEFAEFSEWTGTVYSAGTEAIDGLAAWPPAGYEPPRVPKATTEYCDRWLARISAGADPDDHERMAAALLRATPGSAAVPHYAGVAIEVDLPGGTDDEAREHAEAATGRLRSSVERDPEVTFDYAVAGWEIRPGAPIQRDGPSAIFLEEIQNFEPRDAFRVALTNLSDYRIAPPPGRRYDELLNWAQQTADEVYVRTTSTRYRPATDGRPELPVPDAPERFDPPVPWSVTSSVSAHGVQHQDGIATLRARFGTAFTVIDDPDPEGGHLHLELRTVAHSAAEASETLSDAAVRHLAGPDGTVFLSIPTATRTN